MRSPPRCLRSEDQRRTKLFALEQGVLASLSFQGMMVQTNNGTKGIRLSRDPRVGMFTPKAVDMGYRHSAGYTQSWRENTSYADMEVHASALSTRPHPEPPLSPLYERETDMHHPRFIAENFLNILSCGKQGSRYPASHQSSPPIL